MALTLLATTDTQIIRVVEALYNLKPGYTYLTNFRTFVTENGIDGFANALAASFASSTDAELAAIVTGNLGLTDDVQTAGNAYLEAQFAADSSARGKAILDAMNALANMESDATYGTAAAAFNTDVVSSLTYSTVEANTNTAASNASDSSTSNIITLTTGADNETGSTGDDAIYGVMTGAVATSTLDSFDFVDGAAGTDTMHLTLSGDNFDGSANVSNVEKFTAKATGAGRSFDANGMSGVESIISNRSSDVLTVNNMSSAGTAVGFDTVTNVAANVIANYSDTALAGTDDTVTVNITGGVGSSASGDGDNEILVSSTASTNGAENLTVSVTGGAAYVGKLESESGAAGAQVLKKLTISGDSNLKVTTALDFTLGAGEKATVDSSASTGNVNLTLTDAVDHAVTGGAGDDTLDFGTTLTVADVVDTGAGTDTVKVNADAVTLASLALSNVEVVQAESTAGAALTVTAAGQTGMTGVTLVENNTTSIDATAEDLAADVGVTILSNVDAQDAGIHNLGLADASGTADALTVTLQGTNGAADNGTDNDIEDIAFTNIETLNLVSSHAGTTALASTDWNEVADISTDTVLTALNVSGSDRIKMTVGSEATNLATLDASAATGDNTYTVSATGNVAVTTGTGDDTIAMGSTLTNGDTIDGGAHGTAATDGDMLQATITSNTTTTAAITVANVEYFEFTNTGTAYVNAAGITGASADLTVTGASTKTTYSNLGAIHTVGLGHKDEGGDSNTGITVLGLADATGTSDSVTVNVYDSTSHTLQASGIETVNVGFSVTDTTISASDLTVSALNAASIVVSGATADTDSTLTLNTLDTDTTSLDSTGYKGVLTATGGSATAVTYNLAGTNINNITASTGNDTVTVASTTAIHVIDGGTGTDTMNITLGGAVDGETITNFEVYNITAKASTTGTLAMDGATQNINDAQTTTVNVTGGNSLSVVQLGSGTQDGAGTGANVIGLAAGGSAAALTAIDASGLNGKLVASFGNDVLDANLAVTGGSLTTDTIYAQYTGNATPSLTGVEKLYIQTNGTAALTMTGATGLSTVYVDDDTVAADTTLTDLAADVAVQLTSAAATALDVDLVNKTALDNTLSLRLNTTVGTSNIDIADVETLNLNVQETASVNFDGLSMTTASTYSTLNVTGDSALTITALHADVTTIDSSASTGSVVMSARSATTASTYTGGEGADTFIMKHASDAISSGTGADTLDIDLAAILGGIQVDLSSATDQVTSFNGAANSAIQIGAQHVDLSGYTGFGAVVTASASGSNIEGTLATVDSITGGAGSDQFRFSGSETAVDVITGFTDGTDFLAFQDGGAATFASTTGTAAGAVMNALDVDGVAVTGDGFTINASVGIASEGMTSTEILALDANATATTSFLVVFNETTSKGEIWYDADWNAADGEVQIATLNDITTVGEITGLTAADIYAFI